MILIALCVTGAVGAAFVPERPRRLARPRTPPSHGDNTSSNLVGDAKLLGCFVSLPFDLPAGTAYSICADTPLPYLADARENQPDPSCKHPKEETPGEPSRDHMDKMAENRSEEHTSELQSHLNLVCRLLLE